MQHPLRIQKAAFKNEAARNKVPLNSLVNDEKTHEFWVNIDNKKKKAFYTAISYPFGKGINKPIFIGWYGFEDGPCFFYSSLSH